MIKKILILSPRNYEGIGNGWKHALLFASNHELMRKFCTRHWFGLMMSFLSFRVSRAGVFSNLSAGDSYPLRILTQAGAAVSPTDKSQKHSALPPVTPEKTRPLHNPFSLLCMNFLTHLRACSLNPKNSPPTADQAV